jgi:hypothetical protein
MNFTIRKNSTLPTLKYDITHLVIKDESLAQKFKSSVVTFSMIDKLTGQHVIANKSAKFSIERPVTHVVGLLNGLKYYLTFQWSRRDTSKVGDFRGEFRINSLDGEGDSMVVPNDSDVININIASTITSSIIAADCDNNAPKPAPTNSGVTNSASVTSLSYNMLKSHKSNNLLKQGHFYVINDFQSIHRLAPSGSCTNVLGVVEPLMIMATDVNKFDQSARSLIHESDVIHYNFDMIEPDCVMCDDNKGVITYRKDTVNNLSAYYDWRVDESVNCGVDTVHTFGVGCKNITLGEGSRFIHIGANSSNINIGKHCKEINLPDGSDTITIGNQVSGVDFSNFPYTPYAHKNLTIYDNGRGGQLYIEVDLQQQSIFKAGSYEVGILPKKMMVKDYTVSVQNTSGSTSGARLSFGVKSLNNEELMPDTLIKELNNSYIFNTLFTQVSEVDDYVTMTIKGSDLEPPIDGSFIKINMNFIKV